MEDYFPVNIPFMAITMGWALMVISFCIYLGDKFQTHKFTAIMAKTGQMTLSLYILHMTIGVLLLANLAHKNYTGFPQENEPLKPAFIIVYSLVFFSGSVLFSYLWSKKFKHGPVEALMRKFSDKKQPAKQGER